MLKKVAVLQSNYIPWKGYFDIMHDVDLFLYYDEVQYTKNDWRNRNKIKTPYGTRWLTLPCGYDFKRRIYEVKFNPKIDWQKNHYNLLCENYRRAPYFKQYSDFLGYVYMEKKWEYLHDLNKYMIDAIAREYLGIKIKTDDSSRYSSQGTKEEKLLSLLRSVGAEYYVSGPAAKDYSNDSDYKNAGIEVVWKDYSDYPEYPQLFGAFEHKVTVLDLLFNTGSDAPYFIWGYREDKKYKADR